MKPKINKVVILGAIFNNKGEILVSQRYDPKIPDAHLKWDFIGGTNEFGESLEDTLHRELMEEAGIKVEILSLIPIYPNRVWKHEEYDQHTLVFCFKCKIVYQKENTKRDEKINRLEWKSIEGLKQLDFLDTCQVFINHLVN